MIIIATPTKRLCKDGYLREFAHFGTFKECVKIYKNKGSAIKKARHLNALRKHKGKEDDLMVIELKVGMSIDACGKVVRYEGATPETEYVIDVPYSEILIPLEKA